MRIFSFLSMLLLVITGCSHTSRIGKVGNVELYKVQASSLIGPTITMIVSKPVDDNDLVRVEAVFGGNGIGPALVGAGGMMGSAALLRPSNTHVNNTASGEAQSQSNSEADSESNATSTSTSSTSNPPPPTKPPKPPHGPPDNRPPDNRPPPHHYKPGKY